jgi:hypothetical protein
MNDFWNNPPERPANPTCTICGEPTDFVRENKNGDTYSCTACGHEFLEPYPTDVEEQDPIDEFAFANALMVEAEEDTFRAFCPHGDHWDGCEQCKHAADFQHMLVMR